ncbi:MAG: hypothetical protein IPM16_17035 [Chloroflexi bacterium]|nr:hypothetical protein [Chloroflexota bacterium]
MRRGWTVFSAVTVMMLALAWTSPAAACSGGGPRYELVSMVQAADVIVDGRVTVTDDAGQNLYLHVETYLHGDTGPSEILVSLWPATGIIANRDRRFGGGCFYMGASLAVGDQVIMLLRHMQDGSYKPTISFLGSFARFPTLESRVELTLFRAPESLEMETHNVTRAQLTNLILSVPGTGQQASIETNLPFRAPLLITAESGRHYLMPIDGALPVELSKDELYRLGRHNEACWSAPCTAWSHTGLESAHIGVADSASSSTRNVAVVFPPSGNVLAEWELSPSGWKVSVISTVFNTTWGQSLSLSQPAGILNTAVTALDAADAGKPDLGTWSPDGRILAFVDEVGLWLWDALTPNAEPQLSPYEGVTAVHSYSQTGRYLSVTRHGRRQHIDLVSGEILPDGEFSPGDQILLAYESPRLVQLAPRAEVAFPADIFGSAFIVDAKWIARWHFVALMCNGTSRETCAVVEASRERLSFPEVTAGYAFDFSRDTHNLAVVKPDGRTLLLRDGVTGVMRELDLGTSIDSDIASLEWLPTLFYSRYLEDGNL